MLTTRFVAGIFTVGLAVLGTGVVSAQDYPTKPIRIFTTAAGGGGDFVARQITPGISSALGQPVVIENRPQGLIAAEAVSKMPPDGYALTIQGSTFWTAPLLRKMPYDVNDFAPISLIERTVNVFVVHPALPVKTVKEVIALAKTRPGELNYASSAGVGSTSHLAMELFNHMAGVKLVHVAYKGNSPAITALMSGEVQMMISDLSIALPHMKSARVKPLAVTTAQPTRLVPGVPTVAASGLPGYEAVGLTSIFAPAKTPTVIIRRLNQEIVRILDQPDVKEKFFTGGTEAVSSTPEELAARIKLEMTRMAKVIKDAGIKAE